MKKKLTDDQAEMLDFLAKRGVFENDQLFDFFSKFELWDTKQRLDVFSQLCDLDLIKGQKETLIPKDDHTIEYHVKGMYVTEDAKQLLFNYQTQKQRQAEEKDLQFKKLQLDVKNGERVYRTYPKTQFIAWVTFAIVIILAILKLAEALKFWPYQ
jgi:hypothetical protein